MTEQSTPAPEAEVISEDEAAEIVAEDSEETPETPEEIEEPAPDLDELPEGKKVLALGMQAMAESARQEYLKVYGILDAQDDQEKLLIAARDTSEDENVQRLVAEAKAFQEQMNSVLAQADEILRESGVVSVLTDEEKAAKREELNTHKSAFLDSVKYGEDHVVPGFARLFEKLPGMRSPRTKTAGGDYTMTTNIKPRLSQVIVNGTDVRNDKGSATFTFLSQYLKKDSGKTVQVGDLHKAWTTAAGTENVAEIQDAVFFDFKVGEKNYNVKIVPQEAA